MAEHSRSQQSPAAPLDTGPSDTGPAQENTGLTSVLSDVVQDYASQETNQMCNAHDETRLANILRLLEDLPEDDLPEDNIDNSDPKPKWDEEVQQLRRQLSQAETQLHYLTVERKQMLEFQEVAHQIVQELLKLFPQIEKNLLALDQVFVSPDPMGTDTTEHQAPSQEPQDGGKQSPSPSDISKLLATLRC